MEFCQKISLIIRVEFHEDQTKSFSHVDGTLCQLNYFSCGSRNIMIHYGTANSCHFRIPFFGHHLSIEELWVGGRRETHGGANAAPEPNACAQVLF